MSHEPGSPGHLFSALFRASRSVEERARRHAETFGLCPSDFGILEALFRDGPLAVNAIGKRVLLTSGSMTTAVDRLTGRGLVERKDSTSDRRARTVHLTRQGRLLMKRACSEHDRAIAEAMAALTGSEREEAIRILTKLEQGIAGNGLAMVARGGAR